MTSFAFTNNWKINGTFLPLTKIISIDQYVFVENGLVNITDE